MRVALGGLIFLIAIEASAQNGLTRTGFDTQVAIPRPIQQAVSIAPAKRRDNKSFDGKFFLLAGVATAATMLDVTTTSRCMSRYADCQEGNPLLGSHPSTAKLYGVSFSMLSGQLLAGAWMRRKMPNGKLWMAPMIIAGAGHGLAAILNVRTMHRLDQ
jgi:hypothetical protein